MTRSGGRVLVVVGDVINDVVIRPLAPPAPGTDTPSEVRLTPGGSGANQAAWLGFLGASVRFASRAGAPDAARHRGVLESCGVDARIAADPERRTGTIAVLVSPNGVRSMFSDRGASAFLDEGDLPAALLDGASLLHVSGYSLFSETSRHAVLRLMTAATSAGVEVSVDPCSVAGLRDVGADAFLGWTKDAAVVFPNLDEGRFLSGRPSEDPATVVDALVEHYGVVALTLGPAGVLVGSSAGERIRLEAPAVTVLDPTGAGDAFCAGFLAELLDNAGGIDGRLQRATEAGVAAAAQALVQLGGRPSETLTGKRIVAT
ncbi:MAG: PfkB family carbohydrate kinase [Acidimicrobiales bacterium]